MKPRHLLLSVSALAVAAASPAQGPLSGSVPRIFGWSQEGTVTGSRLGSAIAVLERTSRGVPVVVSVDRATDTVRFFDVRHGASLAQVRGTARVQFGRLLASGDLDGDGLDELVVGADTGLAFLDDTGAFLSNYTTPASFGPAQSLVTIDLDGDGDDEVAIGYAFADAPQASGAGRIDLFDWSTGSVVRSIAGTQPFETLGWRMCRGELQGQPVLFASAPNVTNQSGGTGEVRALDARLTPVFTYGPSGDRHAGSGFLDQHGSLLAVGSQAASQSPFSSEGNVAIVDLNSGATLRSFDGTQTLESLGNSGAFHPDGKLFFTARGTQNQGEFYEWDHSASPTPTALFQGDPSTGVWMHGEVYEDLLGDGRAVGLMGQPGTTNPTGRAAAGRVATLVLGEQTIFPGYRVPSGGSTRVDASFGFGMAGRVAAVLGSLSGVGPTPLPFGTNQSIALTIDGFTSVSPALFPGSPVILDAAGEGSFTLSLPADPSIPPLDLSIAAVAFGTNPSDFAASSDAHTLRVFDR